MRRQMREHEYHSARAKDHPRDTPSVSHFDFSSPSAKSVLESGVTFHRGEIRRGR